MIIINIVLCNYILVILKFWVAISMNVDILSNHVKSVYCVLLAFLHLSQLLHDSQHYNI